MKRAILLLIAAGLLTTACETIIDIDLPEHERVLVVNAHFTPGEDWEVFVSRTVDMNFRGGTQWFTGAVVGVWSGDEKMGTLFHDEMGVYRGSIPRPEAGRAYSVRVRGAGLKEAIGTSTAPAAVPFEITHREIPGTGWHNPGQLEITIRFDDPPGERNFYRLAVDVRHRVRGDEQMGPTTFTLRDETILDLFYDSPFEGGPRRMSEAFFRDVRFDGKSQEIVILVDRYHAFEDSEVDFRVRLATLNEPFYRYRQSVELQRQTEDNPFAEPVQIYSNVKNGVGVVDGYGEMAVWVER
jgi:hypothetical protein